MVRLRVLWVVLCCGLVMGAGCAKTEWKHFTPSTGEFSVLFPDAASEKDFQFDVYRGELTLKTRLYYHEVKGLSLGVLCADIPPALERGRPPDRIMEDTLRGFVLSIGGMIKEERDAQLSGLRAKEAEFTGTISGLAVKGGSRGIARVATKNRRIFILTAFYNLNEQKGEIEKFMSSFKLSEGGK
jgi:hypothetical protein